MSTTARILHGPSTPVFNRGKRDPDTGMEFQLDDGRRVTIHYLWKIKGDGPASFYGVCAEPYEAVIVRDYNPEENGPYEGVVEFSPSIPSTLLPPVTEDAYLKVVEVPENLETVLQDARVNCENNDCKPPLIRISVEGENGKVEDMAFALDMHRNWRHGKKYTTMRGYINTPFGKIPVRANLDLKSRSGVLETLLED